MAAVDVLLEDGHDTVVIDQGVVVIRRAAEQFDIVRAFAFTQIQCIFDVGSLQHAHSEIIESCIVVYVFGIHYQTIVSDDFDALIGRFFKYVRQSRAID